MSNLKSQSYEILEHPADLKIRAYGKDLSELFSCVLRGMFESCRPKLANESIVREIQVKSDNLESLLVDFLSEALYLSDTNNEVYFEAEFEVLTDKELKGIIKGQKITGLDSEIKAVTWHNLEIKKIDNDYWQATVLFDI